MKTLRTIISVLTALISITACLALIKKLSEEVKPNDADYYMR